MKKIILLSLFAIATTCIIILSFGKGECVELWGECYSIANTTELEEYFNVDRKNLEGNEIPSSIGKLINLEKIELPRCGLIGSIPQSIGNLKKLVTLDLSRNQLSGPIPSSIGNLYFLENLSLNDNQLTGIIPLEIGNTSIGGTLDLSSNQLSGPIPSSIGKLEDIELLVLTDNQLSGPIPSSIGNLKNLRRAWLSNNKLSGKLPTEMIQIESLYDIDLSNNEITEIPSNISNANIQLWLFENDISGQVSNSICNIENSDHVRGTPNPKTGKIYEDGVFVGIRKGVLYGNNICPPYPICMFQSDINSQDTSNCP